MDGENDYASKDVGRNIGLFETQPIVIIVFVLVLFLRSALLYESSYCEAEGK
jgi:hypothetical protein